MTLVSLMNYHEKFIRLEHYIDFNQFLTSLSVPNSELCLKPMLDYSDELVQVLEVIQYLKLII